ncbi:MAG: hypothetical protein ACXWVG_10185 [Telluria sp.]
MDVRVHRVCQLQAEAANFGQIALEHRDDGVDQQGMAGGFAGEQISVGVRQRFVKLFDDHD